MADIKVPRLNVDEGKAGPGKRRDRAAGLASSSEGGNVQYPAPVDGPSRQTDDASTAVSGTRPVCSYCQAEVTVDDHSLACHGCGTTSHTDCWDENGGCAVAGCSSTSTGESVGIGSERLPVPPPETPYAPPPVGASPPGPQYSPARPNEPTAASASGKSSTSWRRRAALIVLIVGLPVLAAFGTRSNWFSPVTGQLYTQEQYTEVRDSAYDEGHDDGFDSGFADGRSKGEKAGLRQGYANGRAAGYEAGRTDGYSEGYDDGFYEGCRHPFSLLGATRVMDAWDYEYGVNYASYYTTSICN